MPLCLAHAHDGKLKPTLPTGVDRRESLLLMRLNSKEQEAQDLLVSKLVCLNNNNCP